MADGHFEQEVRNALIDVRQEIKEMARAIKELIKVEGKVDRALDLGNRIGKEVDDLERRTREIEQGKSMIAQNHERRLNDVEKAVSNLAKGQIGNNKTVGLMDFLIRHSLALIVGGAITAAFIKGF